MLENIKKYLKITHDVEDDLIQNFIEWGKAFIKKKTGRDFDENDFLMRDLLQLLVAYRYYNRNAIGEKTLNEYPYSITEMLKTMGF